MDINPTELQTDERLPWHKPEMQRLVVSLDTSEGSISDADGGIGPDALAP